MSSAKISWCGRLLGCLAIVLLTGCAVADRVKSDMAILDAEAAYAAKDYAAAAEAYRRSAESGSGQGQYMLSWMYAEGKGVKRDRKEADHWMRKAAESGYPAANFTMGIRALTGVGEARNPKLAAAYLLKAAEDEDEVAMFYVGLLHLYGTGVDADALEALRWFRMAQAHGYPVHPVLLTEVGVAEQLRIKSRLSHSAPPANQDQRAMVKEIQTQLARLGYAVGNPDGLAGAKTRGAIKAFQRSHGLKVDGVPDAELLDALKAAQ